MRSTTTHPDGRKGLTRPGRARTRGGSPTAPGVPFFVRPIYRAIRLGRQLRRLGAVVLAIGALHAVPLRAQEPTAAMAPAALLDAVRQASPQLAALRSALAAAEARARATGFAPPATLSAEVEEVPRGIDVFGSESMRLELGRALLTGGRRDARRAVAEQDVRRARLELELAERRVLARAIQLLTRVGGTAAIARRLAAEDSLLLTAEEALRPRFAVGDARYVDVLRLRTERLRARSDVAAALSAARVERQQLTALLTGLDSAASPDAPPGAPPPGAPQTAALIDTMIDKMIDTMIARLAADSLAAPMPAPPQDLDSLVAASAPVRRADAAVERALATRRLTLAEQRPIVEASLGAQRFVTEDGPTLGATVGASVSLPFTSRRANRLMDEAADRTVAATRIARAATVNEVRAALSSALERYRAATEQLALYDASLLRGAREERESALAAYRGGELSLLELLDFERALTRAETDRLRSHIAAVDALTELLAGEVETTTANSHIDLSSLREQQ